MVIRLPHDKCSEFRGKDVSVLNSLGSSRKTIESLMGSMAFCAQFCDEACFGKKCFSPILTEWEWNLPRVLSRCVTSNNKAPLAWWGTLSNLLVGSPIRNPDPIYWIWTDASNSGETTRRRGSGPEVAGPKVRKIHL